MQIFRTATCATAGHPEFTIVFREQPPTPNTVGWLVDHLQDAVAGGTRFVPGQPMAIGWRTLRVVERGDETLGLEERVAEDVWEEHVDQTVRELWYQAEAAAKLGLPEDLNSVAEDHIAAVESCAFDASSLILNRVGPDSPQHSWWTVSCGDEHEHGDWLEMELFELAAALPFITSFLALPTETGLLIERRRVDPSGSVVAVVVHKNTMLTPDDGMYFGPQPAPAVPLQTAHYAILRFGEGLYRTRIGDQHGHPDIVARLTEPAVAGTGDSLVCWILDDLQDSIAAGKRFAPGQRIQVGWRTLRVVERADGMLGLSERVSVDEWEEHVEQTLRDLWFQKEVAASLGLADQMTFPAEDQYAVVADCVNEVVPALLLSRTDADDPHRSGWLACCLRAHDHGNWSVRTVWELMELMPFAVQFLALPVNASVAIEAPHTTPTGRIRVSAVLDGRPMLPEPGSYLSVLNAER